MKKIFTLCLLLVTAWMASAQGITLFQQNFESYTSNIISDWQHVYSGPVPFRVGYPSVICECDAPEVSRAASIRLFPPGPNAFMASPVINLTSTSHVWLQYDGFFKALGTEAATVEVSIDSGATWQVVQNVPANADPYSYTTHFIDLSPYAGHSKTRIGFRYTNIEGGWVIDNIKVFAPAQKDLMLKRINPSDSLQRFQEVQQPMALGGTVMNYGRDTITSFVVKYTINNGPALSHTISGISLAPFDTFNFLHNTPFTPQAIGNHQVKMWVEMTGDTYPANDTANARIQGAAFRPKKKLLIEEGTGSWCDQAPRGIAYLEAIRGGDFSETCIISEHRMDSMVVPDYDDYLFKLRWNFVPYFLFDRRLNVAPRDFFNVALQQMQRFGFADLQLNTQHTANNIDVTTTIVPAIDLSGDYRLVAVVIENGVHKNANGWQQANAYAGGTLGPMGGFENKPNPIPSADMYYDRVARAAAPSPGGIKGLLPTTMLHNQSYTQTISCPIQPGWDVSKLRVVVMLVSYTSKDSMVLNSNQTTAPLGIREQEYKFADLTISPNPAADAAKLSFRSIQGNNGQIRLTDITGKTVLQYPLSGEELRKGNYTIRTTGLQPGLYFVTLQLADGRRETLKLQVLK
jgi:hypothetical protein